MNTQRVEGHTPLPWEANYGGTPGHIKSIGVPQPANQDWKPTPTVARFDVETPSLTDAEKEANAALIVYAVNNIERLEKVNEALVKYAEKRLEALMAIEVPSMAELDEHIEIREMLALAKEPA